MTIRRTWPRPPDGAIHLIGDTHFGSTSMTTNRKNLWAADLDSRMLPTSVCHVVVGDVTDHGLSGEDTEAVNWLNDHFGVGQWVAAVGNHDLFSSRTVDQSATAWGMPAGNFVHDLGFARLIIMSPDGGIENDAVSMVPFDSTRLNWLDAQLQAADVPCLIVCHWSLYDTVQSILGSSTSSTTDGFFAEVDNDIRTVLADNSNAQGWLSGHIHCPLTAPNLVAGVTVGGHQLAAINASAVNYTGNTSDNLSSDMATMYVTVTDGRLDVRFRNHGAGIWQVAGPNRYSTWSVAL